MSELNFDFIPADENHIKIEKAKAYELKQSQWWKNQKGKGLCYYCKQRVSPKLLTMDHKTPLIRGGKTTKTNVVASCKTCNVRKKYLLPNEWRCK